MKFPGIDIELSKVLHASESVTVAGPDPAVGHRRCGHAIHRHLGQGQGRGDLVGDDGVRTGRHAAVDARSGRSSRAAKGASAASVAPSTSSEPPYRAPDFELSIPVSPQQALLYRMCGDRNPLHSDPGVRCCGRLSTADSARPVHVRDDVQGNGGQPARRRRRPGRQLRRAVRRRRLPRRDAEGERSGRRATALRPSSRRPNATTQWRSPAWS